VGRRRPSRCSTSRGGLRIGRYQARNYGEAVEVLRAVATSGVVYAGPGVLDAACGPGTNAPVCAHADYVGVDLNERYVESARRLDRFEPYTLSAFGVPLWEMVYGMGSTPR
jgi:SAM-dependent methyltransferase